VSAVIAGVALIMLSVIPLYDGLRSPITGLAGSATAEMASAAAGMTWAGALFACAVGLCTARLLQPARTRAVITNVALRLRAVTTVAWASSCALAAFALAVITERIVFHNEPVLLDAMVQLKHAQYLAAGMSHAPADTIGFFRMQQTAPVAGGWVSQYPPLHVGLLALGELIHAPWLIGPVMLGCAVYFTSRAVDLMSGCSAAPRLGIAAAACSPFMLAHAATYMSHTTAAACVGMALYAYVRGTRATTPATAWLIASGLAIGAAFATRPLTGVTLGLALSFVAFTNRHAAVRVVALLFAGAVPFIAAVAFYNQTYFGSFTRFGYDVALGPHAGLGFGTDPWGNHFGLIQALQYTSAELAVLSLQLFETPIPLVALVGLFLATHRRLPDSTRLVAVVALAPLLTHLAYWHHGIFMGPRMLNDYGVVWAVLASTAIAGLYRAIPEHTASLATYSPQTFFAGAMATAFFGALILAPQRMRSYAVPASQAYALAATTKRGGVVFVHGGWGERQSMQLAARGWQLDDVESAIRQNSSCAVQRVIDGEASRSSLDLAPRATDLPRRVEFPAGNPIRVGANETPTPSCLAQIAADTAGIIDPSSLLWRGALQATHSSGPLFARDLGPRINAALAQSDPDARVMLRAADGAPRLVPYAQGMRDLWKAAQ
jgi:hypothetical protein